MPILSVLRRVEMEYNLAGLGNLSLYDPKDLNYFA